MQAFIIKKTYEKIEMWSLVRLPYEPEGWVRQMRDELRKALKRLSSSDSSILYAYYASKKSEYIDVENVLFYNVGASAFNHLSEKGIVFASGAEIPEPEKNIAISYPYYQCYCLDEPINYVIKLRNNAILAEWSNVVCPPLRGDNKPHIFWYQLKLGKPLINKACYGSCEIGISVVIHPPEATKVNLAGSIKALLDGIISAFHSHDGSNIDYVSAKISSYLNIGCNNIEQLLMCDDMNVLGKRALVFPFREGIKWNPADDRIALAEILIGDSNSTQSWCHDGKIFSMAMKR